MGGAIHDLLLWGVFHSHNQSSAGSRAQFILMFLSPNPGSKRHTHRHTHTISFHINRMFSIANGEILGTVGSVLLSSLQILKDGPVHESYFTGKEKSFLKKPRGIPGFKAACFYSVYIH